jgi:cytochrome c oxidase assembly protein subunit 11
MSPMPTTSEHARRNLRLGLICAGVFFAMVGAAFAAVPLYRAFCQATGYDGTTQRAAVNQSTVSDRTVVVRFDANVRGMPWTFEPVQGSQKVKLGESKLAFFRATNTGSAPVTGRAVFNVVPEDAGLYFSKLECFCFKNQTLQPGETAEFPVVYFVDPRYASDPETKDQGEITLSYTFFAQPDPPPAKAATASSARAASALGGPARAGL